MLVLIMLLLLVPAALGGMVGGPCDSSGQCNDVNAVCVVGRCVCTGEFFQRNYTCGTSSQPIKHLHRISIAVCLATWRTSSEVLDSKGKGKDKVYSSSHTASPLRELTCHMGSHSVTCHPAKVTFPPLPQLIKAGTRFSDPGGMQG